jgi:hypothetical protein
MRLREAARAQLIFSFRKILKPLIRILLRAGIPYLEFREVIKGAYVEAAVRDGIRGHKGPITRAMLSDYTGVSLADVNRFIDDDSLLAPPQTTNEAIITEVLHIWCTDSFYLGPYGMPLELDLEETAGRNLTTLIYQADPTADPKVILSDMVEYGIVKQVGAHHYRATSRSNLYTDIMTPQALEYFGRTITDLANTLEHNIGAPSSAKRLQRSVVADGGMPEYALPEFEALLKDKVQKLLVDVDDWLSANKAHWVEPGRVVHTGLTAYHYITQSYEHIPLSALQPQDANKDRFRAWLGTPEVDSGLDRGLEARQ